jgi:hypothetical protein
VGLPVVLFAVCLCGGAVASAQLLPDLDAGPLGGALALFSQHIYLIVSEVEHLGSGPAAATKGEVVGAGLRNIAVDEGTVLGLAFVVYLLAPRIGTPARLDEEP